MLDRIGDLLMQEKRCNDRCAFASILGKYYIDEDTLSLVVLKPCNARYSTVYTRIHYVQANGYSTRIRLQY